MVERPAAPSPRALPRRDFRGARGRSGPCTGEKGALVDSRSGVRTDRRSASAGPPFVGPHPCRARADRRPRLHPRRGPRPRSRRDRRRRLRSRAIRAAPSGRRLPRAPRGHRRDARAPERAREVARRRAHARLAPDRTLRSRDARPARSGRARPRAALPGRRPLRLPARTARARRHPLGHALRARLRGPLVGPAGGAPDRLRAGARRHDRRRLVDPRRGTRRRLRRRASRAEGHRGARHPRPRDAAGGLPLRGPPTTSRLHERRRRGPGAADGAAHVGPAFGLNALTALPSSPSRAVVSPRRPRGGPRAPRRGRRLRRPPAAVAGGARGRRALVVPRRRRPSRERASAPRRPVGGGLRPRLHGGPESLPHADQHRDADELRAGRLRAHAERRRGPALALDLGRSRPARRASPLPHDAELSLRARGCRRPRPRGEARAPVSPHHAHRRRRLALPDAPRSAASADAGGSRRAPPSRSGRRLSARSRSCSP